MNSILRNTLNRKSPTSFFEAMVEIFNFFGFREDPPSFAKKSKKEALAGDWRMVGDDLRKAYNSVTK